MAEPPALIRCALSLQVEQRIVVRSSFSRGAAHGIIASTVALVRAELVRQRTVTESLCFDL